MKKSKYVTLITLGLLSVFLLAGCEISEEEVKESEYYQELKTSYDSLKKENKELKEKIEEADKPNVDDERAKAYFEKIARDSMNKAEIGYADDMDESVFVADKGLLSFINELANRADVTNLYTPEQLAGKCDRLYQYVLYDEDNSVYEMMVYEGDYVVFADLPKKVYYLRNASAVGDSLLRYRKSYPESNLLHRLADTPLITNDSGKYYENEVAIDIASCINKLEKTECSEETAKKYWKDKKKEPTLHEYSFYHHGNVLKLGLYDRFITIKDVDAQVVWYQVKGDDIKTIRKYFKAYTKKNKEEAKEKTTEHDSAADSTGHNTDIDENVGK